MQSLGSVLNTRLRTFRQETNQNLGCEQHARSPTQSNKRTIHKSEDVTVNRPAVCCCLELALVGGQPLVLAGRALHQEGGDLHLADAVEGGHADVGSWQGLGAGSNLILDLASIGAAEHGQLPHHTVAVVVVALRK